jgi:membrane protein DedA with SNARE-associated domain
VAGAMKYSKRNFFIAVGAARAIRYSLLAWMGSIYSKQIFGFFHQYYRSAFWALIALAVAGGIAALFWTWKRKRDGKSVIPDTKEPKPKPA